MSWASERGLPAPDAEQKEEIRLPGPRHAQTTWNGTRSRTRVEVRELNAMIPQLLDREAEEELEVVGVPPVCLGPRCSLMRKHNQTDPVARRGGRSASTWWFHANWRLVVGGKARPCLRLV